MIALPSEPFLFHEWSNKDEMSRQLTRQVGEKIQQAILARGHANLAVSGGSTPKDLYKLLSNLELDWPKVNIILVDERWVELGETGSNETFVRQNLLQNRAKQARFIGLKSPEDNPQLAEDKINTRLQSLHGPFDVVVLGLGLDGHTASWFPHAKGLAKALDKTGPMAVAIKAIQSEATGRLTSRMTLGLNSIIQAGQIILMFTGAQKKIIWQQTLLPEPVADMPVRALIQNKLANLSVHWAP